MLDLLRTIEFRDDKKISYVFRGRDIDLRPGSSLQDKFCARSRATGKKNNEVSSQEIISKSESYFWFVPYE